MRVWAIITGIAVLLIAASATAQSRLTGDTTLRGAVAAKALVGVNEFGSPYQLLINEDGTMSGVLGTLGQYTDQGIWEIEGDTWCMDWEIFSAGERICYGVTLSGDQLTRYSPDGTVFQVSILSSQ